MNNDRKSLINRFADLSVEAFKDDPGEFYEIAGIERVSYMKARMNHIKKLNLKTMASQQKTANENLKANAKQLIQMIKSGNSEEKSKLKQKLNKMNVSPALFHNVEKLNEQDVEDLLNDKDLLEIVEKLEETENE